MYLIDLGTFDHDLASRLKPGIMVYGESSQNGLISG